MSSSPETPLRSGLFRIFLSYRRADAPGYALRLHDFLRAGVRDQPGFADEQIFMDIDTLEPGRDFRRAIREAVESCDVLLALIGPQWTTVKDRNGRRLENPNDFVRLEIEAALKRDIPVIPLLVHGAEVPAEKDLPESLSDLVYRHALQLNDSSWSDDVGRLLASLKRSEHEKVEPTTEDLETEQLVGDSSTVSPKAKDAVSDQLEDEDSAAGSATHVTEGPTRRRRAGHRETQDRTGLLPADLKVRDFVLSPDGRLLALEGAWRKNKRAVIRIVDLETRATVLDLSPPGSVHSVAFTLDGRLLAAGCRQRGDEVAHVWDVTSGDELLVLKHRDSYSRIALSPDGALLVTGATYGGETPTQVWSVTSGERLLVLKRRSGVHSLAFSPDGRLLATGSEDKTARLWEVDSGDELLALKHSGTWAWVSGVAFSPDGRLLATAANRAARIWTIEDGVQLFALEHGPISSVAFNRDGRILATGGAGGEIDRASPWDGSGAARTWAVHSGEELAVLAHPYPVDSVAFSPTDRLLTTCTKFKGDPVLEARSWDLDSGKDTLLARHPPD